MPERVDSVVEKSADGGYEVNENGMTVPVIQSGAFYTVPKKMYKIEKKSPNCSSGYRSCDTLSLIQMGVICRQSC